MKKNILFFISVLCFSLNSIAQAPNGFNYQATIRDHSNTILVSKSVGIQFRILQGKMDGLNIYSETFSTISSSSGIVNLEIGSGKTLDDFTTIDWGNGPYFIETSIDLSGGSDYLIAGTTQLLSVPYALYAENCGATHAQLKNTGGPHIVDVDGDTKVEVEESADEDIIRFDLAGTERWVMIGARLEALNNGNSLFLGENAGKNDDLTDNYNTFIGVNSGKTNTSGSYNTGIGYNTLNTNLVGSYNTAIGGGTLQENTQGSSNVAIGLWSLSDNTFGDDNIGIGWHSLGANISGYQNIGLGIHSLLLNKYGYGNIAIGGNTLQNLGEGDANIVIGAESGANLLTGSANIIIGNNISTPDSSIQNLNIGNIIFARGIDGVGTTISSGCVGIGTNNPDLAYKFDVLGDVRIKGDTRIQPANTSYFFQVSNIGVEPSFLPSTNNYGYVGSSTKKIYRGHFYDLTTTLLTTLSDRKIKENIQPINGALAKILQLDGKTYDIKRDFVFADTDEDMPTRKREEIEKSRLDRIGFIAQELEEIFPELVKYDEESDLKSVDYIGLIPVLVEAIKELTEKVELLENNN